MTKSPTLSASEKSEVELALRRFLSGHLLLPELKEILGSYLVIDFTNSPNEREIKANLLEGQFAIPLEEKHLRRVLAKFLSGQISAIELSDWAAFIFMAQVFVPYGETEEERERFGEGPVWDILQRLMTPSVFGDLTLEVARQYLDLLR